MSTIEKALQRKNSEKQKNPPENELDSNKGTLEKAAEAKQQAKAAKTAESAKPKVNIESPTAKAKTPMASQKHESSAGASSNGNFIELNTVELEERGFVSVESTRRLINEEYRAIKRKLLQNAFGAISASLTNSNIIMVSSARPGEGKTFTAVNLALSIAAEKDKTVLLVDADVLRPNVSKTLKVEPREGLMEYLLDEKKDISEVMYKTNVEKLRIIPAGRSHHLSTELLASQKMHETIDEIASRYPDRVVIIDTPPLIGINETAILTSFAGQAVVVTVEGKSKLTDITKATSQLNPEMAIGFVVNKAIISADDEQGYYGYYYAN